MVVPRPPPEHLQGLGLVLAAAGGGVLGAEEAPDVRPSAEGAAELEALVQDVGERLSGEPPGDVKATVYPPQALGRD